MTLPSGALWMSWLLQCLALLEARDEVVSIAELAEKIYAPPRQLVKAFVALWGADVRLAEGLPLMLYVGDVPADDESVTDLNSQVDGVRLLSTFDFIDLREMSRETCLELYLAAREVQRMVAGSHDVLPLVISRLKDTLGAGAPVDSSEPVAEPVLSQLLEAQQTGQGVRIVYDHTWTDHRSPFEVYVDCFDRTHDKYFAQVTPVAGGPARRIRLGGVRTVEPLPSQRHEPASAPIPVHEQRVIFETTPAGKRAIDGYEPRVISEGDGRVRIAIQVEEPAQKKAAYLALQMGPGSRIMDPPAWASEVKDAANAILAKYR